MQTLTLPATCCHAQGAAPRAQGLHGQKDERYVALWTCACIDYGADDEPPSSVKLNANRHVVGVLRGFDQFLNIVLDSATDEKTKQELGMVVRVPEARSGLITPSRRWCGATASSPWSHWSASGDICLDTLHSVSPFTATKLREISAMQPVMINKHSITESRAHCCGGPSCWCFPSSP